MSSMPKHFKKAAVAAVSFALSAHAGAQEPLLLLAEGDPTSDGFAVQFLNEIVVADDGSWIAEVNTTNPNTGLDDILYRDGSAFVTPGDPIPGVPGETVDFYRDVSHAAFNLSAYCARGTASGDDFLIVEDTVIAREGDPLPAYLGMPAGTVWDRLELIQVRANGKVLVPGSVQIPGLAATPQVLAVFDTDASHQATGGRIAVQALQTLTDGSTLDFIFSGNNETRLNEAGDVVWWGFTTVAGVVGVNDTVVAQENTPTPDPAFTWRNFAGPELDLNDGGEWVVRAQVTAFPRESVISSSGIVARQGQSHPAFPTFTLGDFGISTPVFIANDGTVSFYADLSGTGSTSDDEVYVVGDQIVVREGVSQSGGKTIVEISDGSGAFHVSRNGRHLIFEGDFDDAGTIREGVFLVSLGFGTPYCTAAPNSTGSPATISASGSNMVADNAFAVIADGLPGGSFGFFLVSLTQDFVAMPGGSQGNLCLGGDIGRYQSFAQSSGTTGSISLDVNLAAIPSPTGSFPAASGMTLNFQAWYRDANPATTSNFTNGVAVTFE